MYMYIILYDCYFVVVLWNTCSNKVSCILVWFPGLEKGYRNSCLLFLIPTIGDRAWRRLQVINKKSLNLTNVPR